MARLGASHGSEEGGLNGPVEGREGAGGAKEACMDPNPRKPQEEESLRRGRSQEGSSLKHLMGRESQCGWSSVSPG